MIPSTRELVKDGQNCNEKFGQKEIHFKYLKKYCVPLAHLKFHYSDISNKVVQENKELGCHSLKTLSKECGPELEMQAMANIMCKPYLVHNMQCICLVCDH